MTETHERGLDAEVAEGHIDQIRRAELDCVLRHFRPHSRLLEIGGGNGLQASLLAARGLAVTSVDLVPSPGPQRFPVQVYDGRTIPYPDQSFDHVYSSNVLEHVEDLPRLNAEIARVLAPGGTAIHVIPTPAWRIWSIAAHYPYLAKFAITGRHSMMSHGPPTVSGTIRAKGLGHLVRRALFPGPHGVSSSAIAEIAQFARRRWIATFRDAGFELVDVYPTHLFYTGLGVLAGTLTVPQRLRLGRVLGSACHVYVVRPWTPGIS